MEITSTVELKTSKPGVTRTEQIKTGYSNVNDYLKYLQGKYSYMNTARLPCRVFRQRYPYPAHCHPQRAALILGRKRLDHRCTIQLIHVCFPPLLLYYIRIGMPVCLIKYKKICTV